jgi:hypothetical protein
MAYPLRVVLLGIVVALLAAGAGGVASAGDKPLCSFRVPISQALQDACRLQSAACVNTFTTAQQRSSDNRFLQAAVFAAKRAAIEERKFNPYYSEIYHKVEYNAPCSEKYLRVWALLTAGYKARLYQHRAETGSNYDVAAKWKAKAIAYLKHAAIEIDSIA